MSPLTTSANGGILGSVAVSAAAEARCELVPQNPSPRLPIVARARPYPSLVSS
jgi:hypothetical protein